MDRFKSCGNRRGYTLLEVLIGLSIISILAAVSIPSYVRYVNEAKAADFLLRIHQIALAYHEVLLVDVPNLQDLRPFDSPKMGAAPPKFDDLAAIYAEHHDIELGSFLVNHSNYFGSISDGEIPVLFLKANSESGRDVLHALDYVTQKEHTFANPSLMIIALEDPQARQVTSGTGKDNSGGGKGSPTVGANGNQGVTPQVEPAVVSPPGKDPDQAASASNTDSGSNSNTDTSTDTAANTGGGTDSNTDTTTDSNSNTGSNGGSASGSTAGSGTTAGSPSTTVTSHLNWPPGWAKHPEQHQGDVFPGQGRHH